MHLMQSMYYLVSCILYTKPLSSIIPIEQVVEAERSMASRSNFRRPLNTFLSLVMNSYIVNDF